MKVKRWRRNEVTPRFIACQAAEASCALHDAHGQRGAKGREAIDVWRGSLDGGARAESRVWWFCSANITQPTAANRRCSKLEVAPSYRCSVTGPLPYEQEYVMKTDMKR